MAISLVGRQRGGFAGTLTDQDITFSLTGGSDSTPAANDIVIVSYAIGAALAANLPYIRDTGGSNYTYPLSGTHATADDTLDSRLIVGYKIMGGSPDTQVRFSSDVTGGTGRTSDAGVYDIAVLRGIDTTTPMDASAVKDSGIDTRLANPPSITPVTAGAWTYHVGAAVGATGGTFTSSDLSDFLAGSEPDTNDAMMGAGFLVKGWASGAQNPAVFTGGGTDTTNDSWTAASLAIRPAAAGGSRGRLIEGGGLLGANLLGRLAG